MNLPIEIDDRCSAAKRKRNISLCVGRVEVFSTKQNLLPVGLANRLDTGTS